MNFPIEDYIKAHYPDSKPDKNGEYIITCPVCNRRKLYYDIKKNKGICFVCSDNLDNEEHTGVFSNLVSFVMFTENLDYSDAVNKITSVAYDGSVDSSVVAFDKAIKTLNKPQLQIDSLLDIPIEVDIPHKIKPDMKVAEKYLNSRKRSMTIKILELFPAWFSMSLWLTDRLIFEVRTNNSYAWLAYYIGDDKEIRKSKKTCNPKGNILSCMLHGYNYFKNSKAPLLIHEGIMDTHRSVLRGYNSVCLFGKNMSPQQVMLINATKSKEVILCLDGDRAGLKGAWGIVKQWKHSIDKPLSMMVLPYGKDPDSVSKLDMEMSYQKRRRL